MPSPPRIRHVVFHSPGAGWQEGVDFREQPGVGDHIAHYADLHRQGKLELGGPFLTGGGGGMMVTTDEVHFDEIDAFAAADPAVKSGLLIYDVRPWYVAMESERRTT